MKIRKPALFFSAIFAASAVFAEIVMPRIFSDNMMFQRDMPLKIWGKADAGARVGVEFKDQKKWSRLPETVLGALNWLR